MSTPVEPSSASANDPAPAITGTASTVGAAPSGAPANDPEDKTEGKSAVKPVIQIVTVANTTVHKPAEQIVQVDRPKGRLLVCRR